MPKLRVKTVAVHKLLFQPCLTALYDIPPVHIFFAEHSATIKLIVLCVRRGDDVMYPYTVCVRHNFPVRAISVIYIFEI